MTGTHRPSQHVNKTGISHIQSMIPSSMLKVLNLAPFLHPLLPTWSLVFHNGL